MTKEKEEVKKRDETNKNTIQKAKGINADSEETVKGIKQTTNSCVQ